MIELIEESVMKVSPDFRVKVERLFEEAYADSKSSILERTIIYAVSLVIFAYMEDEE